MQLLILPKICVSLGQVPRRWTIPRFIMQPQGQTTTTTTTKTPRTTGKKKIKPNEHDTFRCHTGVPHSTLYLFTEPDTIPCMCVPKVTKNHNSQKKPPSPLPQIIHRKDEPKAHHLQNSTKVSTKTNPFKIFSRSILPRYAKNRGRQSLFCSLLFNPIHPSLLRKISRPDHVQFLTHISKASNPSDKS